MGLNIILGKNVNPKNLQEKNIILESKNKVLSFPSQSFRLHKICYRRQQHIFQLCEHVKKKKL